MAASDWIGLAGVLVAAVGIPVAFVLGRRAERSQRELADHERRANLYPALNQWASKVRSTSHIERQERERREVIPPDVMDRAHSYASPAVLAQLGIMTKLRDRDPATFVTAAEKGSQSWEMQASFRRSELLRREAKTLQAIIRNELGADPLPPE